MSTTGTIDRRDRLDYETFVQEYLLPAKPVVVTNAFPEWRALEKWTPEFFQKQHGDKTVLVAGEKVRLGDYIARVVAATPENPCPYLRETRVRELAPELGEDLSPFVKYALPNWLRGVYPHPGLHKHMNRASEVELFIGGRGTKLERRRGEHEAGYNGLGGALISGFADLHYDPTACPVLLCQIHGQKQFTIFAPSDTPYLYTKGRHSMIDSLDEPDLERFPLFKKATPIRFVQQPGEAVYVPPFWWHATKMLSVSIAIGSTFANGAHWPGVIEDVAREFGGDKPAVASFIRSFLKADGAVKARLGERLGADTHFKDPAYVGPARAAFGAARAVKRFFTST